MPRKKGETEDDFEDLSDEDEPDKVKEDDEDETEKRFESINKRFDKIEEAINLDRKYLKKLYEMFKLLEDNFNILRSQK